MRKTRKHGKKKQVKRKHNSKRIRGGGPRESAAAVPYLIGQRLNAASLLSNKQTFNEPGIVLQILQDVPRASVTLALENAPYKKEVEDLLSKKFKRTANSRAIASKIANAISINDLTHGRKKQTLLKELKIAQKALAARILDNKSIDDYKEELSKKLGELEDEFDELEKAIGHSKLDKYDNLKTKYDEVNRSQSMLERSRAYLIGIRLKTLRNSPIDKLYALKDEIDITDLIYTKINKDYIAAHEVQDRLSLIVHNLKKQLRDFEDL